MAGIEPALLAWKAKVLPLNYIRTIAPVIFRKYSDNYNNTIKLPLCSKNYLQTNLHTRGLSPLLLISIDLYGYILLLIILVDAVIVAIAPFIKDNI